MVGLQEKRLSPLAIVGIALLYIVSARIGQLLAIAPGNITPVWLPSGFMVAFAMVYGRQIWPGVFVGAFIGNIWAYFSVETVGTVISAILAATSNGVGDVIANVVVVQAVVKITRTDFPFTSFKRYLIFFALAVIVGPGISALMGIGTLSIFGFLPWNQSLVGLQTWWIGDGVGVLLIAPLALGLFALKEHSKQLEAWGLSAVAVGLTILLFASQIHSYWLLVVAAAILPVFLVAILNSGQITCFATQLTVAATALIATALGWGPFVDTSLIEVQTFVATVALVLTLLSIKISQQNQLKQKLELVLNTMPYGVVETDLTGKITFYNPAMVSILERAKSAIIGNQLWDFASNENSANDYRQKFLENVIESATPSPLVLPCLSQDGKEKLIETVWDFKRDAKQRAYGCIGVLTDITERKAHEENLKSSENLLAEAQKIAHLGSWELDLATKQLSWSEEVYRIFEIDPEECQASYEVFIETIHPEDREKVHEAYQSSLINNTGYDIEHRLLMKDGRIKHVNERCETYRDENGQPVRSVGSVWDITEIKEAERVIIKQAHYDTLTGLPNRFLVLDRLNQLINEHSRTNQNFAVLFVDLDDFKKVNDSLGHETGDNILIDAAKRLADLVRSGDTVARLGGDEFVILLRGADTPKEIQSVINALLTAFRKPFKIENRELILTTSIGVSTFPNDGFNASELLRNADSAMYHAKRFGRNTFSFYTKEMNEQLQKRLAIEEQLRGAIVRDEVSVVFQPQIELSTQKIVGAEALLRWNNPTLGQVAPDEFISIAEQTGAIEALGRFVLSQALDFATRWNDKYNQQLIIAVNISPVQFRNSKLVNDIHETLQKKNFPPGLLELEITEGVLISSHTNAKKTLQELKNLGIKSSMDDFGTGYSSLNYLRKYPFHSLKIDKSFIKDITNGTDGKALVNAAIAMAHALNIAVVAEGAETLEQVKILSELNCDYAQGYHFSRPIPPKEFLELSPNAFCEEVTV